MVNKSLYIIIILLLIPIVVADTFKQSTAVDLRHSVRLQDAPTTTATCNITVKNPDNLVIVPFLSMTYDSTTQTFNYTLLENQTRQYGNYNYDVTCLDSGFNNTESFNFQINTAGRELTTADSILFIFVLLLSLFFFGLVLFGAIKIPFENSRDAVGQLLSINFKKHFKMTLWVLSYLLLTWVIFISFSITGGFAELAAISGFLEVVLRTMIAFIYPLFIVSTLVIIILFINDLQLQKKLSEGRLFNIDGV